MKKLILVTALPVLLSACGGSGSQSEPELGAAYEPEMTNTRDLRVDASFNFASSRSIDIDFDIAEAAGSDASVSICTDYSPGGGAFDVNYESCSISGEMQDGTFNEKIDVTHEFDSVVAVVWFQDPSTEPLYKEFFVEPATQRKGGQSALVWR